MSYIAFARKYRPQTFDDIIGQSHVTTTLKNAISQDRVAHAYLFAGPRGVGKTTAARILAKALNCEKGPTPKPCNICASCKEITQGSSLDILEIDGASNRGIDEIRNLRDNVKFAPAKGKFKIYIIDEVHMLTAEAFNALLKTLEEPPPHVKFIFATTQAHKVPPTILSRCQRFDFRRIATKEIVENLKSIVKCEGANIEDEALALIAKYSDGGMRDAQVMLDQITSFARGKVGVKDITKILGMVEDEALFELSGAIRERNAVKALEIADKLVNEGKDVTQVVLGLIEHFRNISITKISPDAENLIDAGADKIKSYRQEAAGFTIEEMLYIIYTLSNTIDFIKKSSLSRVPLEAALVKLTLKSPVVPLNEVMKRVEALEQKYKTGESKDKSQQVIHSSRGGLNLPYKVDNSGAPADSAAKSVDLEEVLSSWASVINHIMPKKISVASYLQEGYPVSLEEKTLSIGFPKELQFHKEVLESPDNKALIEVAIKAVLGKDLRVTFILTEPAAASGRQQAGYAGGEAQNSFSEEDDPLKKEVDPIVKTALEIFGGDITDAGPGKRRAR
jgi:DNA polymerase-3 subunit gamma/tau